MKIKKGDTVTVIAGKDKGKTGVVQEALPATEQVLVEGVNVMKKHQKPRGQDKKGGIIDVTRPIHVSNVMLQDPKEKTPTRVGKQFDEKENAYVRVAKKSGATL
ncbi:50S ribosomal protein L24 [Patescibacteria group bacterium]|jgi:large subunit ribosomal protein L24|nr:50S ribosomal protein L24 [Patescibacteria group bacterium]